MKIGFWLLLYLLLTTNVFAQWEELPDSSSGQWTSLFNGTNLDGWHGLDSVWSVEDGAIVARNAPYVTFLAHEAVYKNFVFSAMVKLKDNVGNSGIQYRSFVSDSSKWKVAGYQANIKEKFSEQQGWGDLYEEGGRGWVKFAKTKTKKTILMGDWNLYQIMADGNHLTHRINGVTWLEYTEMNNNQRKEGIFALQHHGGPPIEILFKDIKVLRLPP